MTVYGFKSFARETVIEFSRGITGLVGPNGGGKSNVVDALRWALGEQRPRELRAERWADVLFQGSAGLPPGRLAEVTLDFDQVSASLPDWPDTVSVARRYYRNGDSEYVINGRAVRLKDVTDLFLDSGLGRSSYAIIGQGGVEAALLMRPKERLEQLEESAGVSRYKLRRSETLQHLAEADAKLDRLRDLVSEISEQAEAVAQAAELEARLASLDDAAKSLDGQIRRTHWERDQSALQRLQAERQALVARIRETGEKAQEGERLAAALDSEEQELQPAWVAGTRRMAQLNEKIRSAEAELARAEAELESFQREREDGEGRVRRLWQQLEAVANADPGEAGLRQEVTEAAEQSLRSLAAEVEAAREDVAQRRVELADLEGCRGEVSSALEALARDQARLEGVLGLPHAGADIASGWHALMARYETMSRELAGLGASAEKAQRAHASWIAELRAREERAKDLRRRWQEVGVRLKALAPEAGAPSMGPGVRAVLSAPSGIARAPIGTVGSVLRIEERLKPAMMAALGGAQQDLVVDSEMTARQWVEWLKREGRGRATFLPLDVLRPYALNERDRQFGIGPGVVGWAVDLVDFDPAVERAVRHVLGRILVVERLQDATRLGREHRFRFRTVTLDGQILHPGGAISGGSRVGEDRRRNEYVSLEREHQQLEENWSQTEREVEEGRRLLAGLASKADAQRTAWNALNVEVRQLRQTMEGLSHLGSPQALVARERELSARSAELTNQLDAARAQLGLSEAVLADKERELATLRRESNEREQAETVRRALRERDRSDRARWSEELAELTERLERLKTASDTRQPQVHRLQQQILDWKTAGEDLKRTTDEAAKRLQAVRTARRQRDTARRELEKSVADAKSRLAEVEQSLSAITARWQAAPLTDWERERRPLSNEDLPAAEARRVQIRTQISQLGPVQAGSLSRYRAACDRRDELLGEIGDVEAAQAEMQATIAELDDTVAERVRATAKAVETEFQRCCETLFGGGTASFRWVGDGQSGIDLWVAPPGKRPARLSLLSGGEKALGGVAWLFSLLAIRPAPFVVLDEVEASLDEMNAEHFSRFLRTRRGESQLIVITHHKATMEATDALWGISGDGKGQSRVISVRLEDPDAAKEA